MQKDSYPYDRHHEMSAIPNPIRNANNIPFYRYGGPYIKLISFKEYYGMPREHEHYPLYSLSIRNMVFHCIFLRKKAIIITS